MYFLNLIWFLFSYHLSFIMIQGVESSCIRICNILGMGEGQRALLEHFFRLTSHLQKPTCSPYNLTKLDTKEDKHRIKKFHEVQEIPVSASRKLQPKKINTDNLQASNTKAVTYAMGIDYAMVKEKITWYYSFPFSYKITIGMKMYTRSYDLSVKTMHLTFTSLIPICLTLINPLIT
jgi:hypothetical protein